jgi:Rrf2 family transcriptional regulator, iron-sulfur cluster assembly transcription factor
MQRLNRKIEYALIALKVVLQRKSRTSVKEICELTGVPFDATARVMQIMAQNGLLQAEHGVNGGYKLVKDLQDVSMHDLMSWILGPVEIAKCLNGDQQCELISTCNITTPMANLNKKLINFYSDLSIAEVVHAG